MHKKLETILSSAIFSSLALLNIGCFSQALLRGNNPNIFIPKKTDSIFAITKPDQNELNAISSPNAIVLFGEENTYLLTEGGELLMRFSKELNGKHLFFKNHSTPVFIRDNVIWGELTMVYESAIDFRYLNNDPEISKLYELGFQRTASFSDTFERKVSIKGAVLPKLTITASELSKHKTRKYITFFDPPNHIANHKFKTYALMPVAIISDTITAPFQILGLSAIRIIFKNMH